MTSSRLYAILTGLITVCAFVTQVGVAAVFQSKSASPSDLVFTKEIKPLLEKNCISCHSGGKPAGGLSLVSYSTFKKGGSAGPLVAPKLEDSLLFKAVSYRGPQMPPSGKLPAKDVEVLTRWIASGGKWPMGVSLSQPSQKNGPPQVNAQNMKFWSFQRVQTPVVPGVKNKLWTINQIDNFVLHKLDATGLSPNPQASKTVLLRRATYDLTGLPPTSEQVAAFLSDSSPSAWEKVVDRLLASPQYGEKWGRHWLDLVHYAETNSYERDGNKPFAWRYRDYVINSLNQDKPYNKFITEQLAGDELPEKTPDNLIATGYYRMGLWDDEPADPQQALYDDLDDIATVTGQVFLGLTINCARCHDHKIDPIPQKDYYRFIAFFNGINRFGVRSPGSIFEASQRPISPLAEVQRHSEEMRIYRVKQRGIQERIVALEQRVLPTLIPVEKEDFTNEAVRPQIMAKRIGSIYTAEEIKDYRNLLRDRRVISDNPPKGLEMALCVTEQPEPRETHILMRGNPHVEGELVTAGFPSVLSPPSPKIIKPVGNETSGRRLALAEWVTSKENPLTARVMVNRVWQYHFGRGIVRTPSNYGFQGSKPTHPELLDYLASEFQKGGWKLKPLHKMIMMSATYRMSSSGNTKALAIDPENDNMWRFDMRRLEAEEVRDSILAVNGSLNLKMGGPSFYTTIPAEVLAGQSVPGSGWGKSTAEEEARRSVYIYVKRSLITPMIASFDGAETDFSCPVRFATVQPTQALGMINSEFVNKESQVFAHFLKKNAGDKAEAQVKLALTRVIQREPNRKEIDRGVKLMETIQNKHNVSKDIALVRFCTVVLNLNEFLYVD